MILVYFKNLRNKFLNFFDRKKRKVSSGAKKNSNVEEDTSDDIYPLWWIYIKKQLICLKILSKISLQTLGEVF